MAFEWSFESSDYYREVKSAMYNNAACQQFTIKTVKANSCLVIQKLK